MANQNRTIAFRLHDALTARLASQAAERQMSVGELSRQIVIEHLSNTNQAKLNEAVVDNRRAIERLALQLRLVTMTLLCNAGHAEPQEALDWVQNSLGPVDGIESGAKW